MVKESDTEKHKGWGGAMGKRATLKDVAAEAGVTTTTVSYVINNTPGQSIRQETRDRVLAAVTKLKYMPNAHARVLRSQDIPCVGVVIHKNLAVPRFSQLVFGIQEHLERKGYNVLLLGSSKTSLGFSDYVSAYLAGRVGGIIFIGTEGHRPDEDSLKILKEEQAPLVLFNCNTRGEAFSSVDFDYEGGAGLITSRVIARGCPRILYYKPQVVTDQERLRESGVRKAVEECGDVELLIRNAPITSENIEIWDTRYSVGDTDDGIRLTEALISSAREALTLLDEGDAVIASWATWTHYFRKASPSRSIVYAELANNGESWIASHLYTRMPNYEAGVTCAREVISLMHGSDCRAQLIELTNVVEVG